MYEIARTSLRVPPSAALRRVHNGHGWHGAVSPSRAFEHLLTRKPVVLPFCEEHGGHGHSAQHGQLLPSLEDATPLVQLPESCAWLVSLRSHHCTTFRPSLCSCPFGVSMCSCRSARARWSLRTACKQDMPAWAACYFRQHTVHSRHQLSRPVPGPT